MRLTIVKPKKAKTPVAVGAGGAEGEGGGRRRVVADEAPEPVVELEDDPTD